MLLAVVAAVAATGWWWGASQAGYLLATCSAAFGVARLVAPTSQVGPLAVRSKVVDGTFALGFALLLAVITYALPEYS